MEEKISAKTESIAALDEVLLLITPSGRGVD